MAKDKDRAINPATAQLKADKARALKKGKAAITAQRTERLAQRNPARLERQIADLKASRDGDAASGGARDKKQLEELEKQLGMVRKAREKVGDKGPRFGGGGGGGGGESRRGRGGGGGGILGKRARGEEERGGSSGSETDESVRRIPMPRDTPPPIPFPYRDRGDRGGRGRGARRGGHFMGGAGDIDDHNTHNANLEPLGPARERHVLPPKPEVVPAVPKTTYEAKPVVRDLRKEAVKAFMPAVVARKVRAVKGEGGRLLEEEKEVERLEREGYLGGGGKRVGGGGEEVVVDDAAASEVGEGMGEDDVEKRRLEEEEERFGREVRMEEVRDEDL
ncbi:MAG: hypothetical protein LQ349_000564 [Xanthoria aureola]|nr:MAG: hypothetical protein LQ349_000564 [Xanthoria aureola]